MIKHFANITEYKRIYYGGNEVTLGTPTLHIQDREVEIQDRIISIDMIPEEAMKITIYDREEIEGKLSDPINYMPSVYFGERISIDPAMIAFRGAANSSRLLESKNAGYNYVNLLSCGPTSAIYIPMENNGITYVEYLNGLKEELRNNMRQGFVEQLGSKGNIK